MFSIEPADGCGQIDGGEEVTGGFIVVGGNSAVLLEPTEEVFDEMASLVKLLVIVALILAVFLRRNDDFFPRLAQRLENALFGIIRFVG